MTAVPVSNRSAIAVRLEICGGMGLDAAKNLGTLFESRNDGSFAQPTEATPVRDTPPNTLLSYIANDERDANTVRKTAGKA